MTEHQELIAALRAQTAAMAELAESNRLLAESNCQMVDYLAEGLADADEAPRRTDLAGRPL